MSKPKKTKAPKDVEAIVSVSEDGSYCRIEIACDDGEKLSPQDILDATSDGILHFFNVADDTWSKVKMEGETH